MYYIILLQFFQVYFALNIHEFTFKLPPLTPTLFSTIIKKYDLNINSEKRNTANENQAVIRHRHKRNKKRDNKDRITRECVQLLPQAVRDRDDMMDNAESFKSM